jgi:hypothetical protein
MARLVSIAACRPEDESQPAMPIRPLLAKTAFDPETADVLVAAFDTSWKLLKISGSILAAVPESDATREILARRIIETAQLGEKDPFKLVDDALANLASVRRNEIWKNDIKSIDKV